MTNNELANLEFQVDYQPSKITILNEEKLSELVNQMASTYSSLVFTDDNVTEAKEARAELNKVAKRLDDERKKVKSGFTTPLDNFENKMNGYKKQIKEVADSIGNNLTEYEEEQRKKRLETVQAFIKEEAESFGLEAKNISFNNSWLNKGAFTAKGQLTKGTKEDIEQVVQKKAKEVQRIAEEKATVEEFANMAELEPYAWSAMIDKGLSSSEVIEQIKKAIEQRKQEEEKAEQRRKEQEELAQKTKAQFEEQQARVHNKMDKHLRTATNEAEKEEPQKESEQTAVKQEEPEMEFTLHIRGKKSALFALNKFMIENNIEFKKVSDK